MRDVFRNADGFFMTRIGAFCLEHFDPVATVYHAATSSWQMIELAISRRSNGSALDPKCWPKCET